jgi:Transposase IS66 family
MIGGCDRNTVARGQRTSRTHEPIGKPQRERLSALISVGDGRRARGWTAGWLIPEMQGCLHCLPMRTETIVHTLCERVESFLPELFVFVAYPGVPSDNNLAERSVRPLVIAHKISGDTRSPKDSSTRMGLASLFGTWMAPGFNPFSQCLALLTAKSSLG